MQPQVNIEACCTLCSSRGEVSVPRPMLSISELLGQVSCDTDSKQTVKLNSSQPGQYGRQYDLPQNKTVLFWGRSYWHTDFRLTYGISFIVNYLWQKVPLIVLIMFELTGMQINNFQETSCKELLAVWHHLHLKWNVSIIIIIQEDVSGLGVKVCVSLCFISQLYLQHRI